MKQFVKENFASEDDIQVQIPTARLGFVITLAGNLRLEEVKVRARMVSPTFGTKTIIERMDLRTLFEISAQNEGFYRIIEFVDPVTQEPSTIYLGHVDIARGGALALTNSTYCSVDVSVVRGTIRKLDLYSIQHPTTTNTYLRYNPVTINQGLQNIQLDKATEIVFPLDAVAEMQFAYPGNTVSHLFEELRLIADMQNDLVSVRQKQDGTAAAIYGYDRVLLFPIRDPRSGLEASRVQVEVTENQIGANFNVYLIEEKTL